MNKINKEEAVLAANWLQFYQKGKKLSVLQRFQIGWIKFSYKTIFEKESWVVNMKVKEKKNYWSFILL